MPHGQGPVASEADYEALLPHLYPPQTEHLRARRLGATAGAWRGGGAVARWVLWSPRTLFGIQRHFTAFYDQPELMQRMNRDLAEYYVGYLREVGKVCRPAFMTFAEDMSYNKGPMLSRALFQEFIAPGYRRVVPVLQEMGTRIIVDTDGDPSLMIDWMQAVGSTASCPRAAGGRRCGAVAGRSPAPPDARPL